MLMAVVHKISSNDVASPKAWHLAQHAHAYASKFQCASTFSAHYSQQLPRVFMLDLTAMCNGHSKFEQEVFPFAAIFARPVSVKFV